jgi:hypothetical protein
MGPFIRSLGSFNYGLWAQMEVRIEKYRQKLDRCVQISVD